MSTANDMVLKYLNDTNRPYSCVDVTANLRGAHSKAAVQRALDALSESDLIRCKIYGKQRVYVATQKESANNGDVDLKAMDQEYLDLSTKMTEKTSALKLVEAQLKVLTSAPSTEVAIVKLSETQERVQKMKTKLKALTGNTNLVTTEEREVIVKQHTDSLKEYRKRKRICNDILEAILEGYPKSKKCLIEELCLETDESVEFVLNPDLS